MFVIFIYIFRRRKIILCITVTDVCFKTVNNFTRFPMIVNDCTNVTKLTWFVRLKGIINV